MRPLRFARFLVLASACGCLALRPGPARGDAGRSQAPPGGRVTSERRQLDALLDRINRRRAAIGCGALVWDSRLAAVAQRHSTDMVRRHFFSHTNPDGDDPFDRLRAAGLGYWNAAENLAAGQRTAAAVYESWMESPGHRHNMENCVYTHAGLGLASHHWTLVLTRPAPRVASRRR